MKISKRWSNMSTTYISIFFTIIVLNLPICATSNAAQQEVNTDEGFNKACALIESNSKDGINEALKLLKISAKNGNLNAASKVGEIYFSKKNWFYNIIAIQYLSKGIKQNHPESCVAMANFYLDRKKPKINKGLEFLDKADYNQNGYAKANLAKFYSNARFGKSNDSLSTELYKAGSMLEDKICMFEYGKLLFDQSESTVFEGVKLIQSSANKGYIPATNYMQHISDSLCALNEKSFMRQYDAIIYLIENNESMRTNLLEKLALSMIRTNDERLESTLKDLEDAGIKTGFDLCKEILANKIDLSNKQVMHNCYLEKIESGDLNAICGYLTDFTNGSFNDMNSNYIDLCLSSGDECCFPEFEDIKKLLSITIIYKLNEHIGTDSFESIDMENNLFNNIIVSDSNIDNCVLVLNKLTKYNSKALLKTLFCTYLLYDSNVIKESDLGEISTSVRQHKRSDYVQTRDEIINDVISTNRVLIKREIQSPYIWMGSEDSNLKFNYQINSNAFDRSLSIIRFFSGDIDSIEHVLSKFYLAKGVLNSKDKSKCEEYFNMSYYYASQDSTFLNCETYALLAALHSINNSPYFDLSKARSYILKMDGGICDPILKKFFKESINNESESQLSVEDVAYLEKAANSGDIDSAIKLGAIYSNKDGKSYNLTKALHTYQLAERKSGIACYRIAKIHNEFGDPLDFVLEYLYSAQSLGYDADDLMSLISELEHKLDRDKVGQASQRAMERTTP